MIDRFKPIGLS